MAQQLTVQAWFLGYVFSFALTGLVWLVRKDQLDYAALPVSKE